MKVVVTSPAFSRNEVLKNELLRYFPSAKFNDAGVDLSGKKLFTFTKDADALIIGREKADKHLFRNSPKIKIISKYGVGLDNIDAKACEQFGVAIGWTGGVNKLSVAEMTVGYMLALTHNVFKTALQLRNGKWDKNGGYQLAEKTIGIIGAGFIGKEVIRLLKPFNCRILVNDIIRQEAYLKKNNLIAADKRSIFELSDIVSIHVPLTSTTKQLVSMKQLSLMRSTAFLINTSRGEVIDQNALKKALRSNRIAGAALDVFVNEPPTDLELLRLPNLIATPHIGGNTQEAVMSMGLSAISHLKKFFRKK